MRETVEFNGVKFRRYPDAKQRTDRVYYTPGIADKQRGVGRLHEEVWKAANGPIPDGHHIHHKDDDPLNNALANLDCVPVADHMRHHHAGHCSTASREHLERIRPLTKAWHGSEEGLEWHRQHAHNSILATEHVDHVCDQCGKDFKTKPNKLNRFCSNACKSASRRAAGLDNVTRNCEACGQAFETSKYFKVRSCSRKCAGVLISRAKTSSP